MILSFDVLEDPGRERCTLEKRISGAAGRGSTPVERARGTPGARGGRGACERRRGGNLFYNYVTRTRLDSQGATSTVKSSCTVRVCFAFRRAAKKCACRRPAPPTGPACGTRCAGHVIILVGAAACACCAAERACHRPRLASGAEGRLSLSSPTSPRSRPSAWWWRGR